MRASKQASKRAARTEGHREKASNIIRNFRLTDFGRTHCNTQNYVSLVSYIDSVHQMYRCLEEGKEKTQNDYHEFIYTLCTSARHFTNSHLHGCWWYFSIIYSLAPIVHFILSFLLPIFCDRVCVLACGARMCLLISIDKFEMNSMHNTITNIAIHIFATRKLIQKIVCRIK